MFTGIIEATARVQGRTETTLTIERPSAFTDVRIGASIALSGVCLSVVQHDEQSMTFDVIPTTRARSTLGSLKIGDRVNLERALLATGRFDGHVVQGHAEGVGTVTAVRSEDATLTIRVPALLLPFIVPRGSITIDGVSLTIAELSGDLLTVALIPHTFAQTTLGSLCVGDRVNLETDILVRSALYAATTSASSS